jgi:hypothetical protein
MAWVHLMRPIEVVRHDWEISNAGGKNWILPKRDQCKSVLLRLSLAGNLKKPLVSLYETEWRERGYGLRSLVARQVMEQVPPPLQQRPASLPLWRCRVTRLFEGI